MVDKKAIADLKAEIEIIEDDPETKTFTKLLNTMYYLEKYVNMQLARKFQSQRTGASILMLLVSNGGKLTATQLSNLIPVTHFGITKVVDTLASRYLVKRVQSSIDRRVKNVVITDKGIDFVKKILPGRVEIAHEALSFMNNNELTDLSNILDEITKNIADMILDT